MHMLDVLQEALLPKDDPAINGEATAQRPINCCTDLRSLVSIVGCLTSRRYEVSTRIWAFHGRQRRHAEREPAVAGSDTYGFTVFAA